MTPNVGTLDKAARIVVALAAAAVIMFVGVSTPIAIALGAVAAIMLLTSVISFCPIWAMLGVKTCPVK